ncbi:MAG: Gfo/Idh/MocA family oxidoreductase [Planctomycetaceae bacterium]|jgi:predicted dehydrogenase|nr:Gfo/Idh/MocA family oxidoreductase [Planctomycetaceae bacterium]
MKTTTRREFLKKSIIAGTTVSAGLSVARFAHAQGNGTIKIGLIGCGSRGLGAANQALSTGNDVRIVAIGDYFKDRAKVGADALRKQLPKQCDITEDRIFDGFQNDLGVIASGADVILIACAAKFHPLYAKHALEAGKHVFVEKPNAIDSAGIHTLEEAIAIAREKKLSFLAGLNSRYSPQYQALVEQIHNGAIGEIRTIQSTFLRAPYGVRGYPDGMSELDMQVYNQYMFSWLSGDDFIQSLVHNIDRVMWLLGGKTPTHAFGMGGRASMTDRQFGNVFDHHAATFIYPDDSYRVYAFCRTEKGCYNSSDDLIIGTKGVAYLKAAKIVGETNWRYEGQISSGHMAEQVALFTALRKGERIDSGDYVSKSTTLAILGQIAAYTGKMISWQELYDSKFVFKPAPEECVAGIAPPVVPGLNGSYPVPIPGQHSWF